MSRVLRRPSSRCGSVLIVVLWASVGLVSVALLFGHSMVMTYRGADNDLAGRQADQAIEGGVRYAESLLVALETPGTLPLPTSYQVEAVPVGEATIWFLGRPAETNTGTTREFGLVDEASKVNLNTATTDMLLALPGVTEEMAAAIIDWRSAEGSNSSTSGGVTKNTTEVKHAPFESSEELALVAGMTRQILDGEDANLNGVLDANEDDGQSNLPADNSDGKLDPGLLEYVTVFSKEPAKQSDGTSDRIDLATLATPAGLDPLIAMIVVAYSDREQKVRDSLRPGTYNSVVDFFMNSGIQDALTDDEFDKIAPNLMAPNPDPTLPPLVGLINVNTASETVLGCVKGLTTKASEIVAGRLTRGTGSTASTGIAWAARLLDPATIKDVGPYLTGQTYQVSADVAAVGRHGRGYRRTRFVIDVSDTEKGPQIVYRRNLAPLGWALGKEVRQTLALQKEVR